MDCGAEIKLTKWQNRVKRCRSCQETVRKINNARHSKEYQSRHCFDEAPISNCVCPDCGKKHRRGIVGGWTGRGVPKIRCYNCEKSSEPMRYAQDFEQQFEVNI